ncbi:MAG: pilus assembly protein [Acidimicrobiia bacterium]|nr:pilus assembly protein [Acidimicrobiia bacterium]
MTMVRRLSREETGFSAIWTAITAFLLIGVAALAVDVSGFYREATFEQSAADMTCLAGVRDLPQFPTTALNNAAAIAQQNWPEMAAYTAAVDTATNTATLSDGAGNSVTIVAGYGGDPTKMAVTVSQAAPTQFGKVLGVDSAQVTQQAYCKIQGLKLGDLPFGAAPSGGFDGVLQKVNPCDTGNCRPLEIPRNDGKGASYWFIRNTAIGGDAQLTPGLNPPITCAPFSGPCNIVNQDQGVSTGQLSDGIARGSNSAGVDGRLQFPSTSTVFTSLGGRVLDGDTLEEILDPDYPSFSGKTGSALSSVSQPPAFDPQVHAALGQTWADIDKTNHVYFNETVAKCDSPRLGRIPIIAQVGWSPGDPVNLPSGNSDPVEIVGFYLVLLDDPNQPDDFENPSDSLKTLTARVLWLGPNASCSGTGGQVKPYENGDVKVIRLVDQNA